MKKPKPAKLVRKEKAWIGALPARYWSPTQKKELADLFLKNKRLRDAR